MRKSNFSCEIELKQATQTILQFSIQKELEGGGRQMEKNTIFTCKAGAFDSNVSFHNIWGKNVLKIVIQMACDSNSYKEICLSNTEQIDELIGLLQETKRSLFMTGLL